MYLHVYIYINTYIYIYAYLHVEASDDCTGPIFACCFLVPGACWQGTIFWWAKDQGKRKKQKDQ